MDGKENLSLRAYLAIGMMLFALFFGCLLYTSPRNTTMNKDIFFVDSIKSPILKKGKIKVCESHFADCI